MSNQNDDHQSEITALKEEVERLRELLGEAHFDLKEQQRQASIELQDTWQWAFLILHFVLHDIAGRLFHRTTEVRPNIAALWWPPTPQGYRDDAKCSMAGELQKVAAALFRAGPFISYLPPTVDAVLEDLYGKRNPAVEWVNPYSFDGHEVAQMREAMNMMFSGFSDTTKDRAVRIALAIGKTSMAQLESTRERIDRSIAIKEAGNVIPMTGQSSKPDGGTPPPSSSLH